MCHARKERVLLVGTDQRITSGPAATAAAFRGRIHGCTRIVSRKVRFFSLAPRAPSIHGTEQQFVALYFMTGPGGTADLSTGGLDWCFWSGHESASRCVLRLPYDPEEN